MNGRRIARLIKVQKRVHNAQRGVLARAQAELHQAVTDEERAKALQRIQAGALTIPRPWAATELPAAAEFVTLAKEALIEVQERRLQRSHEVERARSDLQTLGQALRRLREVQRRLDEAGRVEARRAAQLLQDDIGAHKRRCDEDSK